jgi:hypothetical protein
MSDAPWDDDAATESPVSISQTIKFGAGYDAPWLVARGPDAKAINSVVDTPDYKSLVEVTAKVARYAQKAWTESGGGSVPAAAGGSANTAPKAQPDRMAAPSGETKFCKHGARDYKEGVSKAGKTYKGFFCTSTDRDDQCGPDWAK